MRAAAIGRNRGPQGALFGGYVLTPRGYVLTPLRTVLRSIEVKARSVIPALTALMVLYVALFCACPQTAHASASDAPSAPVETSGCHGHEAPVGDEPTPGSAPMQPHQGCDCAPAAGVVEAAPSQALPVPAALMPPPVVSSLLQRLLAEAPVTKPASAPAAADVRPPGASGSLLRQRCALNL